MTEVSEGEPVRPSNSSSFLNVDLEIEASFALEELASEMGRGAVVLYCGPGKPKRFLLNVESSRLSKTQDAAASALCLVVERLSRRGKQLWERAELKRFDIGYELLPGQRAVQVTLKEDTLKRIVALRGTVAFTCYRREKGL